jgi:hypothetical protein
VRNAIAQCQRLQGLDPPRPSGFAMPTRHHRVKEGGRSRASVDRDFVRADQDLGADGVLRVSPNLAGRAYSRPLPACPLLVDSNELMSAIRSKGGRIPLAWGRATRSAGESTVILAKEAKSWR